LLKTLRDFVTGGAGIAVNEGAGSGMKERAVDIGVKVAESE
jgi:hypothetical protein